MAESQECGNLPQRTGQPDCRHYLRTGCCKFGATCRFHHPLGASHLSHLLYVNKGGLPVRPGEPLCSFYMRHYCCGFGSACKFHHPPLGVMPVTSPEVMPPLVRIVPVTSPGVMPPPLGITPVPSLGVLPSPLGVMPVTSPGVLPVTSPFIYLSSQGYSPQYLQAQDGNCLQISGSQFDSCQYVQSPYSHGLMLVPTQGTIWSTFVCPAIPVVPFLGEQYPMQMGHFYASPNISATAVPPFSSSTASAFASTSGNR